MTFRLWRCLYYDDHYKNHNDDHGLENLDSRTSFPQGSNQPDSLFLVPGQKLIFIKQYLLQHYLRTMHP